MIRFKPAFGPGLFASLISVILFPAVSSAGFYGVIEDGWEDHIRGAIFRIADTQFEEGLNMVNEYIKAFPDNPGGYFFYAAGVHEKIQKFNDLSELDRFYKYAGKSQKLSKKRLKENKDDLVAMLFLGATDGYIGLLEAKQRHLVRAFKNAIETKKRLERVLKERPDIPDTYFGLGMVYYFSSKKGSEEGGLLGWIIRRFITDGEDMRRQGVGMLSYAARNNALSAEYARSALMWILLYEHKFRKAEEMAHQISDRYQRDTMSRWVLGRIALIEGSCEDAKFWFSWIRDINASFNLPASEFKDVEIAIKKAVLCESMKKEDYEAARAVNREIEKWLNGEPKITLEYQDENTLIKFWKLEAGIIRKKLDGLAPPNKFNPVPG